MLNITRISLMFALSCLFGCASYQQVMVNPADWEQVTCSAQGFGYRGEPMARATYESCVFNLKTLGYVTLEEAEAKDSPKFVQERPTLAQADRPAWRKGFSWEYSVDGKTVRYAVDNVATTDRDFSYQVAAPDGRVLILNGNLDLSAVMMDGVVETGYDPPLKTFVWPLAVGRKWDTITRVNKGQVATQIARSSEVGGFGKVKVPAGEFEAYYILSRNGDGSRAEELWYSQQVGNNVKRIVYTKKGRTVEELLRFNAPR
jgi:hypothetical protein